MCVGAKWKKMKKEMDREGEWVGTWINEKFGIPRDIWAISLKRVRKKKRRKRERKKETQWPATARGWRWDIQASRSQTAEVRLGLRHPNPVYECHTNRQTTHGRPKSWISPEALHLQPMIGENTSAVKYLHQSQPSIKKCQQYNGLYNKIWVLNELFS